MHKHKTSQKSQCVVRNIVCIKRSNVCIKLSNVSILRSNLCVYVNVCTNLNVFMLLYVCVCVCIRAKSTNRNTIPEHQWVRSSYSGVSLSRCTFKCIIRFLEISISWDSLAVPIQHSLSWHRRILSSSLSPCPGLPPCSPLQGKMHLAAVHLLLRKARRLRSNTALLKSNFMVVLWLCWRAARLSDTKAPTSALPDFTVCAYLDPHHRSAPVDRFCQRVTHKKERSCCWEKKKRYLTLGNSL